MLQGVQASAVVRGAAVGEAVVTARLCRQGVRLTGLRHVVEPFEEALPDAFCSWCCGWREHTTSDHRCSTEGCRAKRDHACAHVVAKCRNCSGPHLSLANVFPAKREARQMVRCGGHLPHHIGSGGAPLPGQVTTSEAAEGWKGDSE